MVDLLLQQEPQIINIEAILRDSFSSNIDFDIDLTGYVVTAAVDVNDGSSVSFAITETDLSAGQVAIALTAAQMATIGEGVHHWYAKWVITATSATRTAFAGTFIVTKYGK